MKKAVPKKTKAGMVEDKRMDEHFYVFFLSWKFDSVAAHHMGSLHSMKLFVHNKKKQNLDHFLMKILSPTKDKPV